MGRALDLTPALLTMRQMHSNRLSELRKAAGLQRYDIAARLRVDQSTVYRWERGGTIPDERKLQLAELFDVSAGYLMGWEDEPRKSPRRKPRLKAAVPA